MDASQIHCLCLSRVNVPGILFGAFVLFPQLKMKAEFQILQGTLWKEDILIVVHIISLWQFLYGWRHWEPFIYRHIWKIHCLRCNSEGRVLLLWHFIVFCTSPYFNTVRINNETNSQILSSCLYVLVEAQVAGVTNEVLTKLLYAAVSNNRIWELCSGTQWCFTGLKLGLGVCLQHWCKQLLGQRVTMEVSP